MDLLHTLTSNRYWSKVYCSTTLTLTYLCGLEVKVIDVEIWGKLMGCYWLNLLKTHISLTPWWIKLILSEMIGNGIKFYTVPPPLPSPGSFTQFHPNPAGRPWGQGHSLRSYMLKFVIFMVKVFKDAYLPNPSMDLLYTFTDTIYIGLYFYAVPHTLLCDL